MDQSYLENNYPENNVLYTSFECHSCNTLSRSFPVPLHWHYFAEIIRVRSGSLKIQRGDSEHLLRPGDAVFISPLMPHALNDGEEGISATYDLLRLDMEQFGDLPSYTPDLRGMMQEAERRNMQMVFTAEQLERTHVDRMLDNCVEEYNTRAFGYDLRIRSLLYLMITTVIRSWIAKGFVPQNCGSSIDPIYTLPSYIARHIHEPLKVEELASFCGLSYPWFARKFREIYGISCKDYIEQIRVAQVEKYLLFTDLDLMRISELTGYADCSHMIKNFKRIMDTTPGQYRLKNR